MKRVLLILLLSFSSILFAKEYNEFGAFNFLGQMPIVTIKSVDRIEFSYFENKDETIKDLFFPHLLYMFMYNSTFENECWNQNDFSRETLDKQLDQYNQFK